MRDNGMSQLEIAEILGVGVQTPEVTLVPPGTRRCTPARVRSSTAWSSMGVPSRTTSWCTYACRIERGADQSIRLIGIVDVTGLAGQATPGMNGVSW